MVARGRLNLEEEEKENEPEARKGRVGVGDIAQTKGETREEVKGGGPDFPPRTHSNWPGRRREEEKEKSCSTGCENANLCRAGDSGKMGPPSLI